MSGYSRKMFEYLDVDSTAIVFTDDMSLDGDTGAAGDVSVVVLSMRRWLRQSTMRP